MFRLPRTTAAPSATEGESVADALDEIDISDITGDDGDTKCLSRINNGGVVPAGDNGADASIVEEFYDLGAYARGREEHGLSGYKVSEILAGIAMSPDSSPSEKMRAIAAHTRLLDRLTKAAGLQQQAKATLSLPGGLHLSVTTTAVQEVGRVSGLLAKGMHTDKSPLYSKAKPVVPVLPDEIDKVIANEGGGKPEQRETRDVKDEVRSAKEAEGATEGSPVPDAGDCVQGDGGRDGGPGDDEGSASPSAARFCESTGSGSEGFRHIGHFAPIVYVPGGGLTGVPNGANPFSYGQERCISVEEARRLVQRAHYEGLPPRVGDDTESTVSGDAAKAIEEARRTEVRPTGSPTKMLSVGPIPMFQTVWGRPEEDQQAG